LPGQVIIGEVSLSETGEKFILPGVIRLASRQPTASLCLHISPKPLASSSGEVRAGACQGVPVHCDGILALLADNDLLAWIDWQQGYVTVIKCRLRPDKPHIPDLCHKDVGRVNQRMFGMLPFRIKKRMGICFHGP